MTPSISPSSQVWWAIPAIFMEDSWDFCNVQFGQSTSNHHFACKFHPCRLELKFTNFFSIETSQSTVKIADWDMKEESTQETQHRVSQIAVQGGHSAWLDSPKTISHHKMRTASQLVNKVIERAKIIAVVGITHDDIAPM